MSDNIKKIEMLSNLRGQLVKIETELEEILDHEMYLDLCEHTGTVSAYLKLAAKTLKEK